MIKAAKEQARKSSNEKLLDYFELHAGEPLSEMSTEQIITLEIVRSEILGRMRSPEV